MLKEPRCVLVRWSNGSRGVLCSRCHHGGPPSAWVLAHLTPQLASGGILPRTSLARGRACSLGCELQQAWGRRRRSSRAAFFSRRPARAGRRSGSMRQQALQVLEHLHRSTPQRRWPVCRRWKNSSSFRQEGRRRRKRRAAFFSGGRRGAVGAADPGGAGQAGRGPGGGAPTQEKASWKETRKPFVSFPWLQHLLATSTPPPPSLGIGVVEVPERRLRGGAGPVRSSVIGQSPGRPRPSAIPASTPPSNSPIREKREGQRPRHTAGAGRRDWAPPARSKRRRAIWGGQNER